MAASLILDDADHGLYSTGMGASATTVVPPMRTNLFQAGGSRGSTLSRLEELKRARRSGNTINANANANRTERGGLGLRSSGTVTNGGATTTATATTASAAASPAVRRYSAMTASMPRGPPSWSGSNRGDVLNSASAATATTTATAKLSGAAPVPAATTTSTYANLFGGPRRGKENGPVAEAVALPQATAAIEASRNASKAQQRSRRQHRAGKARAAEAVEADDGSLVALGGDRHLPTAGDVSDIELDDETTGAAAVFRASRDALAADDLQAFLHAPTPPGRTYQFQVLKKSAKLHPTYYLYLEGGVTGSDGPATTATAIDGNRGSGDGDNDDHVTFVAAARKKKKSRTAHYIIGTNQDDLRRESDGFVGKLRSNFMGTDFVLYDHGLKPSDARVKTERRKELASVLYEKNVLGGNGPRRMTVGVPYVDPVTAATKRWRPSSDNDERTLSAATANGKSGQEAGTDLFVSKAPVFNEELGSYTLNFNKRVSRASVKNFQLCDPDDPEHVILQFGRCGDNSFTMDVSFPLSPLQAFAISLSACDRKLGCE